MKNDVNTKYLQPNFDFIETLQNTKEGIIEFVDHSKHSGTFEIVENSFTFSFNSDVFERRDIGRRIELVKFKSASHDFIIKSAYFSKLGMHISNEILANNTLQSSIITTSNYDSKKNKYFRLIIPTKEELDFFLIFDKSKFETESYIGTQHIGAKCNDIHFEIYNIKNGSNNFAVIDCNELTTEEEFDNLSFSILVSFGYITGFMPGGMGYYFGYDTILKKNPDSILVRSLRDDIKTSSIPVCANPSRFLILNRGNTIIKTISSKVFSNLVSLAHKNIEFSTILLVIIESGMSNVIVKQNNYAVALEMIANYILKDKAESENMNFSIIQNDELQDQLIKDINLLIDDRYKLELDRLTICQLKKKISDSINYPANNNRLKKQFELLNIDLFPHEKKAIKNRNNILHGRLPKLESTGEINKAILFNSDCLYLLLSLLIMKLIGYDGHVVNYPKLHEYLVKTKVEGDHYRKIKQTDRNDLSIPTEQKD